MSAPSEPNTPAQPVAVLEPPDSAIPAPDAPAPDPPHRKIAHLPKMFRDLIIRMNRHGGTLHNQVPTSFICGSFWQPDRAKENSPAIYRWFRCGNPTSSVRDGRI
jgi:hypothetical protein